MDVCMVINDDEIRPNFSTFLRDIAALLRKSGMKNVVALTWARVPIVKFTTPDRSFSIDMTCNNVLAIYNTKLLNEYSKMDDRVRPLAYIIKYWAKRRCINETYRGFLSSYCYVLMAIHFLQNRNPSILPCLQTIPKPDNQKMRVIVDGFNVYFYDNSDLKDFGSANQESLGTLLIDFFDYYANRFNYKRDVICVRKGKILTKQAKKWHYGGKDNFEFCVEDPFQTSHNLGRIVTEDSLYELRSEFKRAHKILSKSRNLVELCKQFA